MNTSASIQTRFDNGRYELINENYLESTVYFTEVLELDPNHKMALVSRGSAFLKLEKFSDAVNDFDRAIEIDPQYARAHHLRGVAHEMAGYSERALDDFSKAIDIDPDYGAAYYSRAVLLTLPKPKSTFSRANWVTSTSSACST